MPCRSGYATDDWLKVSMACLTITTIQDGLRDLLMVMRLRCVVHVSTSTVVEPASVKSITVC